jgi:hypothetical protein
MLINVTPHELALYIPLYIYNVVSLTNLMFSDYSDRDRVYLFQLETRILRVLHIAMHCPLPAAKIRGPTILEVSPCSD